MYNYCLGKGPKLDCMVFARDKEISAHQKANISRRVIFIRGGITEQSGRRTHITRASAAAGALVRQSHHHQRTRPSSFFSDNIFQSQTLRLSLQYNIDNQSIIISPIPWSELTSLSGVCGHCPPMSDKSWNIRALLINKCWNMRDTVWAPAIVLHPVNAVSFAQTVLYLISETAKI